MRTWRTFAISMGLLALLWPFAARTAPPSVPIDLPIGGTRVTRVGTPVNTVSIVSRNIAEVIANPPDEIIITGRNVGKTELTAVDKSGNAHTYLIRVTSTGDTLRDKLNALFPNQRI